MYFRTDLSGYTESSYPKIIKIKSVRELNDYFENNKDYYQFHIRFLGEPSMEDVVFSSGTAYNEEFFESSLLLFIVLEEGSGSVRHRAGDVVQNSGSLSVNITRVIPEIGTADMAQWHIVIAMDKSLADNDIAVILNEEHKKDD